MAELSCCLPAGQAPQPVAWAGPLCSRSMTPRVSPGPRAPLAPRWHLSVMTHIEAFFAQAVTALDTDLTVGRARGESDPTAESDVAAVAAPDLE